MSSASPSQSDVIESGLLISGFNCVLQMPTGTGKTWLAEQAIAQTIQKGARAVYLTPLRALAAELFDRWRQQFTDFKIGVFTGDYGPDAQRLPASFTEAQLLIMTPERLDACTRSWRSHWNWIPEVDLIVIDELHLLGDRQRGGRLEGAISRMRRLNPFARIIGLSATLGNRHELAEWLDGIEYASTWRPVPLTWRFVRYRKAQQKPRLLLVEINRNIRLGGQTLVFVQSRRRAEELAHYLSSQSFRVSHHHAGLHHDERRKVEQEFRQHEIDIIVTTSTLEMGINLPSRQVILYDLQAFDGTDFRQLPTNNVWQRAGRAGRRGLDESGEAVLIVPAWDRDAEAYIEAKFEPIISRLAETHVLAEQIIVEIASGLSRTRRQLRATFKQSLAAHQQVLPDISAAIEEMLAAGMITEAPDEHDTQCRTTFRATRLGWIAMRHLLSPESVLLFKLVLQNDQQLSFFDLLLIAACSRDCVPVLPVDFEELEALTSYLREEQSYLLQLPREKIINLLGVDGKRLLASIKMALVARAYTRLANAEAVAEKYDCYPFEVSSLRESISRLLLAMHSLFEKPEEKQEQTLNENASINERVAALHAMIVAGLDEFAVTLTLIKGLGPKMAKHLQSTGISDVSELAQSTPLKLASVRGLSQKRAARWIAEARQISGSRSAFLYRETAPLASITPRGWPASVDPYRLRRALELTVAGMDGGNFLVTGGLEPHIVRVIEGVLLCDCPDSALGQQCKHMLAVRLRRENYELKRLARELARPNSEAQLDIFSLWFGSRSVQLRRRVS